MKQSAKWFELDQGPFLVKAYPSAMKAWSEDPLVADRFVDIVTMEGKPPLYTGYCVNACADVNDCVLDVFLSSVRHSSQMPIPNSGVITDTHGWNINGPRFGVGE